MRLTCPLPSYSALKAVAVKLNNTFILFDAGGISKSGEWKKAHEAMRMQSMHFLATGSDEGLVIPRIVSIKEVMPTPI